MVIHFTKPLTPLFEEKTDCKKNLSWIKEEEKTPKKIAYLSN